MSLNTCKKLSTTNERRKKSAPTSSLTLGWSTVEHDREQKHTVVLVRQNGCQTHPVQGSKSDDKKLRYDIIKTSTAEQNTIFFFFFEILQKPNNDIFSIRFRYFFRFCSKTEYCYSTKNTVILVPGVILIAFVLKAIIAGQATFTRFLSIRKERQISDRVRRQFSFL